MTLISIIHAVFRVYYLILLARVFLSWFRIRESGVTRFLYEITEPPLSFIRRILPMRVMVLDFSPVILIFIMGIVENTLIRLIYLF